MNCLQQYFESHIEGPGIWKWLHYFDVYHQYLQKFIGKEVSILEIGIYSGGSLEMWRQYLGQNCHVYGVDIEEKCKAYENEYTKIFIGDQEDHKLWRQIKNEVPELDIIIDDGGHQTNQQIVTIEETLNHLKPGGIYICEDVHNKSITMTDKEEKNNGFTKYIFDMVNKINDMLINENGVEKTPFQQTIHSISFYPYMIVIEKANNDLKTFIAPKKGTQWQPWCD